LREKRGGKTDKQLSYLRPREGEPFVSHPKNWEEKVPDLVPLLPGATRGGGERTSSFANRRIVDYFGPDDGKGEKRG